MTIQEAIQQQLPLAINIKAGANDRACADLFLTADGVLFVDVGWMEAAIYANFHPFHHLQGKVTGKGPWRLHQGTKLMATIRYLDHGDPLAGAWNDWMTYRLSPEGRKATRSYLREMVQKAGWILT